METLTQDPEDRQSAKDQGNFGVPRRAWEFTSLSNERDRPALAKPRAQMITDVLTTFGWRDSRAEPRSVREDDASVLQPAVIANGTMGARVTRLSDDSAFTALALKEQPLSELVTQIFLRVLSRPPTRPRRATSPIFSHRAMMSGARERRQPRHGAHFRRQFPGPITSIPMRPRRFWKRRFWRRPVILRHRACAPSGGSGSKMGFGR